MVFKAVDAALRARPGRGLALLVAVVALSACFTGTSLAASKTGGANAGGAASDTGPSLVILERGDEGKAVKRLQRKLRLKADGVFGKGTERAVKRYQRRKGIRPVDGVAGIKTLRALGLIATESSAGEESTVRLPRVLKRIAECESGGDPTAISPDGRYRGKYQFSRSTWRSVGGKGDPAEASETEQDKRALKLYRKRGTAPWPNCG